VDETDLPETVSGGFVEIVRNDVADVLRQERVQIEGVFDGNALQRLSSP
jgi:hypothetical protein